METVEFKDLLKEELQTYHEETLMPAFGAYTEQVVLPAIESVKVELRLEIKQEIGKLRSEFIDFVTRQIQDAKVEILKEIREQKKNENMFRTTVIDILERNSLADSDELTLLRGLVAKSQPKFEEHF